MDKMHEFFYLMFENSQNNCWLDASIVLIANNKSFQENVKGYPDSQIRKFTEKYKEAIAILNDSNQEIMERIGKASIILRDIQNSTLSYLKQYLKFKPGEPESAFCALLNLIYHDNSKIKENMNASWIWQKNCGNCGINSKSSLFTKPIITFPRVNNFHPVSPTCVYTCSCKTEQEMNLVYKELPNCLIFHFEKGAGTGSSIPLSFIINEREYQLTSVLMLEKSSDLKINHFVTWIREPFKDMWLDCNDLNTNIVKFSENRPEMELKNVYMCVYEAFDDLGKISHESGNEQTEDIGQLTNTEVIDLSGGEDLKATSLDASEVKTNSDSMISKVLNMEDKHLYEINVKERDISEKDDKIEEGMSRNIGNSSKYEQQALDEIQKDETELNAKQKELKEKDSQQHPTEKNVALQKPTLSKAVSKRLESPKVTSLDAPEVKTNIESTKSRVLSMENKHPYEMNVKKRNISEKDDRMEEGMPKNVGNSSKYKRQALDEIQKDKTKLNDKQKKLKEKDSQQNPIEKTVTLQKPTLSKAASKRLESPTVASLDAPEVKTNSESLISRILKIENKHPYEINVKKRDISEKCEKDDKIEEGMPKNIYSNSKYKRQKLDEIQKGKAELNAKQKKLKIEEKESQQINIEKNVVLQKLTVSKAASKRLERPKVTSLDAPEVKTNSDNRKLRVLNIQSKHPCEIIVKKRNISEKYENNDKIEEGMPKNIGNSSKYKRQALDEIQKGKTELNEKQKKFKVEEKESQQNPIEKNVVLQKPTLSKAASKRLENIIDKTAQNVFAAFMEQILKNRERKNL